MGPANYDLIGELPQEKKLGCGIVDARNTRLETVEDIAEAIKRVSGSVSPDRPLHQPKLRSGFSARAPTQGQN